MPSNNSTSSRQVLYISYDGMTDPLGQSQVLPYLTGLSRHGYRFTILSFEKKNRFEKEGHIIRKICADAGIEWNPVFFTSRPPILSKIYDRWKMRTEAHRLYRKHKFDMVHCRSYIAAEMGLAMKNKYGTKFLFDMRGFWADEKVDGGQWDLSKPLFRRIYNHYKKMEKKFLLNADAVISLTEAARNELQRQPAYDNLKVDVIPCCADLALFDYNKVEPSDTNQLRESLKIPAHAKVITYLGSIGGWYMTKEMFSFVRELLKTDNNFVMLVLTKDEPARVITEAAREGIPADKLVVTYAARKELPVYLSLSTVSVFFIRASYSKIASSPTKHAELMGMGIPVVCNPIGDTGTIVEKTGTGIVVNDFNTDALKVAAGKINLATAIPKQQIRASAMEYFNLEKGILDYLKIYERIFAAEKI